jgi:RNA polymerase sigma-70 factor (ECF subfamily)
MPSAAATLDEEAALLLRHRDGDGTAFPALVQRYRRPVWAYLGRAGVDSAAFDDLFQDIFIKVHRAVGSFDASRPGHPWIFTIVANTVRSHLRQARVRRLLQAVKPAGSDTRDDSGAIDFEDPAPDAERTASARQAIGLVQTELQRLRPVERQVVLLACVEKLPQADIAAALDLPVNTVKTHLRRARLTLGRALAKQGIGGLA